MHKRSSPLLESTRSLSTPVRGGNHPRRLLMSPWTASMPNSRHTMKRLIMRIAFSGVPGAGKTTAAQRFPLPYVSEYARDFIQAYGPPESIADYYFITKQQLQRERPIMVTDSPIHLVLLYAPPLVHTPKDYGIWEEILLLVHSTRYDAVFHLPPRATPVDDGVRSPHLHPEWQHWADLELKRIFRSFPNPFYEIPSHYTPENIA